MTSEEKTLQLKKIDQLGKIILRLEMIIILMGILAASIIATIFVTRS
jgi:hypothetical protein